MKQFSAFLLLLFLVSAVQPAMAQKKKKKGSDNSSNKIGFYEKMYQQGVEYNDLAVATQAVHSILVLQPDAVQWMDTLSGLYFQRGAFAQCLLTTTQVMEKEPKNERVLEMQAISKENLGLMREALADYESLYKMTGSAFHQYEIATIQYSLRRFGECEDTINRLLANPDAKDEIILIAHQKGQQKVPFYAACENLLGVLMMDQGMKEFAKKHFNQALQLYPDFILAKGNLAAASKE